MKTILFCALFLVTTNGLADQPRRSERDYAVMTAEPYKGEIELGQKRLDKFLRRLDSRRRTLLDQTPFVAIQVRALTAGDTPWLVGRFFRGTARSMAFTNDLDDARSVPVEYLLIFDPKTGQPLSQEGYVALDTPAKGKMGIFGGYTALYIGTGR